MCFPLLRHVSGQYTGKRVMKNMFFAGLFVLVAFVSAGVPAIAEDGAIAVISMERVFDKHHKTQEANMQLKARVDEMDKERQGLLSEVKTLKAEMEKLSMEAADSSLSETAQKKIREQAREKFALFTEAEDKLLRFDRLSKSRFSVEMRDTQQEIVDDIRQTIQQYIKEKNIRLVLDYSGKTMNGVEAIIYFDRALDITDDIISLLNEKTPKE